MQQSSSVDGPSSPVISSPVDKPSPSTPDTTITPFSLSPNIISLSDSPNSSSPKDSVQRRPRVNSLESSPVKLSPQFSTTSSQLSDNLQNDNQEKENVEHIQQNFDQIDTNTESVILPMNDLSESIVNIDDKENIQHDDINENENNQQNDNQNINTINEYVNDDTQENVIVKCPNCNLLMDENDFLERRVARLEARLYKAVEVTQTHGQRLLRAAFQDKIREITAEHAHKTTEMLNLQKRCCEEELEAMENESQATITSLQMELRSERATRERLTKQFQAERDGTLERTEATMYAVQRKLGQLHARATRLEREKNTLVTANSEKQVMIEVLASTAAAKDVERRRLDLLSKTREEERERKNKMIESLQNEVLELRKRLEQEGAVNASLLTSIERLQSDRDNDIERHAEDMADCKKESKQETERLGRLFASVMQDFANAQSDVSTTD